MQFERFAASSGHLQRLASRAIASFAVVGFALAAMPASAATLDRIKETGTIKLGYLADARPFSFRNESGQPRVTPSRYASRSPIRPRKNSRCRA